MPPGPTPGFLRSSPPLAIAHRGGGLEGPENTMATFANAVALGYTHLETDARLTADGVVVAFHDETVERLTGVSRAISDLRWEELRELKVGTEEPPARLEEVLEAWPAVRLNIDAKEDAVVEPLTRLIRRTDSVHRVCLASFNERRVARLRSLLPGVTSALGSTAVARLRLSRTREAAGRFAGDVVQVPPSTRGIPIVTPAFLDRARAADLQVHVWTIDAATEMHRLLDMGVHGIMTDRPALLKQVLTERGQWADG